MPAEAWPSPQAMVAVKSPATAAAFASLKFARITLPVLVPSVGLMLLPVAASVSLFTVAVAVSLKVEPSPAVMVMVIVLLPAWA